MKITVKVTILLISLLLSGCSNTVYKACVNQPYDVVSAIELLDTSGIEAKILYTLEPNEVQPFWDQLMAIDFKKYYNDPPTEFGALAVRITYCDGYTDIIGMKMNGYYNESGEGQRVGWFYVAKEEDFISLFSQFLKEDSFSTTP